MKKRILAGLGFALGLMMLTVPAWAGDAEVGMVDGDSGEWHVREPNGTDRSFFYGNPGDIPLIGDWDCDGVETPGMFRPGSGFVYLTNGNPADNGVAVGEIFYFFGVPGDIPIAGDWDGDGCDSLGIYRNGKVFLRDKLSTGFANRAFFFGVPGDRPFAGDWDGNGTDTVGIYRNGTGQIFYTNENPWSGIANTANDFFYGVPSDEFIPGDWDGDGVETVGIFRPSESRFYLRNENSTGGADEEFVFGQNGWLPIGGDTELRDATLSASTGLLDLGAVGLNGTGTATLTVSFSGDSGDADLRITAVEFGQNGFDFSAAPLADPDIGFGESRAIEVSMAPTTLGVKRGFIRIRHTGADSPLVVDLLGRSSYRVNAGGDPIQDWVADSPFSPGGNVGPLAGTSVSGPTAPDEVFESYRFGQQAWDFAVTPGAYRVNLYFAETFLNSAGARLFNVDIEGVEVLTSFDIYAAAGGKNNGIVRGFDVTSDANLDVDFTEIVNSPAIQGIEVIPMPVWKGIGSTPSQVTYGSIAVGDTLQRTITVVHLGEPNTGSVSIPGASITGADSGQFAIITGAGARTVTPGQTFDVVVEFRPTTTGVFDADLFISHSGSNSPLRVDLSGAADDVILYRLNTGGNAVVGQFSWSPDEAFLVNNPVVTGEFALLEAINTSDQSIPPGTPIDVIRTERFGPTFEALGYDLPVPNGPYEVRLYFVEPVHNASGIRVFDVKLEGGLAINDLDIFARAGKNKAIMIPVQTNVSGGILDIDLVPIAGKNLPAIHGIEVIKKEGNAFLSADPLSLTLGPIVTAGTTTANVEISHEGGAGIPSIVIQAVSITGPGSSRFTLLSGPSAGDVLPPGTSDTAQIRFTPGVIGDKTANLSIQYNGGRVITVPLVGSVNNPPAVANPGTRTGTEGVAFAVTVLATDPDTAGDGDFRTMTASGVPSWATVSTGDGTITISGTPGFTDAGPSVVTLTVTDPDGLTDSESFTISIANFNRPPTFVDPLENQTNSEGDTVSISTEAIDLDADDLTWSATGLPGGVTINPSSGLISGTIGFGAGNPDPGVFNVIVTVTDNGAPNKSVAGPFFWTVFDENQAPVATPGLTATMLEGGSVVVTLTGTDGDGDVLTFNAFAPVNGTLGSVVQGPPDQQATVTFTHNGSETTTASFQFNASDGVDISGAGTVNITVSPVNDPPVATPVITATVVEAGSVNVTLTAADPDGPTLTFAAFAPVNGTLGPVNQGLLTNGTATVTFTHNGSETTSASFQFNATDGTSTSAAGTVNITVTPQNDPPVATPVITATVLEGGAVNVTLTATDGDGDPLTFAAFAPVNGSVGSVVQGAPDQQATVTFTHNGSETTTASFQFNASDGTVTSGAGTVTITVTPVNDAPVVTALITGSVAEGGAVNVTLTGSDPDGPTLSFNAFGETNGTLGPVNQGVLTDGQAVVTYTHNGSSTTSAVFSFNATDGTATSAAGTVNLTVTGVNDPPVPTPGLTAVVNEAGSVVVTLTATDEDGDVLTFNAFAPVNGTLGSVVQGAADQQATVQFNHDGSETTTASFDFNATDGQVVSAAGTVNITVTPQNDLPVANPVSPGVLEGGSVTFTLTGSDVDGDSLTFSLFGGGPSNGSITSGPTPVTTTSASITYLHSGSETLTDSFQFRVNDGTGFSTPATVSVVVTPVNDAPVVTALIAESVAEGGAVNVTLTGSDPDGPTLSFNAFGETNGTLGPVNQGVLTDGQAVVTYTHNGSSTTSAVFSFNATDGTATSAAGTVNLTVTGVNDPPVPTPGLTAVVNEAGSVVVTLTATDEDGDVLTFNAFAPVNGTLGSVVQGAADQQATVQFNHDGSETTTASFDFNATDGQVVSAAGTVNITVNPVNDPPTVTAVIAESVAEGGAVNVTLTGSDPDGPTLSFNAFGETNGTLGPVNQGVLTDGQAVVTYTHNGSSTTSAVFSFNATDGTATSAAGTVNLTVTGVNDPPVPTPGLTAVVNEAGSVVVTLTATDEDGDVLTFNAFAPVNGTLGSVVQGAADQQATVQFNHDGSETTTASFDFNATDGQVVSAAGTVNITVTPQNDLPVANPVSPGVLEGGSVTFTLTGSDVDGDSLTFSLFGGGPSNGSITSGPTPVTTTSASITYLHSGSETLTDSFQFRVNDGTGFSTPATVSVVVTPVNDAPVVTALIAESVAEGGAVNVTLTGSDPDGPTLSFNAFGETNGTLGPVNQGVLTDGQAVVTYTHNGSSTTSAVFSFNATDGTATSAAGTVNLTVTGVNDPPVPTPGLTAVVNEAGSVVVTLTATDEDGDVLTFNAFAPVNGTLGSVVQGAADQQATVQFNHDGSETTTASFDFNATDGQVVSAAGTVNITVNPVNDAPVPTATPNPIPATEDGPAVPFAVAANDPDGPSAACSVTVAASKGTASFTGTDCSTGSYVPTAGQTGADSFTVTVNDGGSPNESGTVVVNVNIGAVNDAPVPTATPNPIPATEDGPAVPFAVAANDPDGPSAACSVTVAASKGTASFTGTDCSTGSYVPTAGQTGADSFTVTVNDGGSPNESGTVVVNVNIGAVNDAPVPTATPNPIPATEDGPAVPFAVAANDPDGPSAACSVTVAASKGTASFTGTDCSTGSYVPTAGQTGADSFTVTVNDGGSPNESGTVVVNVNIGAVNDAPVPTATPNPIPATEDGPAVPFAVAANDPDGPSAACSVTVAASKGTASFTGTDCSTGSYVPTAGQTGADSFTVTVNDGGSPNESGTVVVNVNIGAVNDAPVPTATPNPIPATEDGPAVPFAVAANDPDGPSAACSVTVAASKGTASFTGTDCSTGSYVPTAGQTGADSFTVTVNDGGSPNESGTVVVNVNINALPIVQDPGAQAGSVGVLFSLTVTAVDDGSVSSMSTPTLPSWLTATDQGGGSLLLEGTPTVGDIGANPVQVAATDDLGASSLTLSFDITVS